MRYLALAVLMLPLLAACGEPEVKEPTTSATPSSSPSPDLTPPTIPAQAKEDSPEGAAALANAWVKALNHAALSGETSGLRRLSKESCRGCNAYMRLIENTYSAGGYYRDNAWNLSKFEVESTGSARTVYVHVTSPGGTFRADSRSEAKSGTAEDGELIFGIDTRASKVTSLGRRK